MIHPLVHPNIPDTRARTVPGEDKSRSFGISLEVGQLQTASFKLQLDLCPWTIGQHLLCTASLKQCDLSLVTRGVEGEEGMGPNHVVVVKWVSIFCPKEQ